jgi:hypothetical protein
MSPEPHFKHALIVSWTLGKFGLVIGAAQWAQNMVLHCLHFLRFFVEPHLKHCGFVFMVSPFSL